MLYIQTLVRASGKLSPNRQRHWRGEERAARAPRGQHRERRHCSLLLAGAALVVAECSKVCFGRES